MQFDKSRWFEDLDGFWLCLRVKIPQAAKDFCVSMKDRLYNAELKEHRERRSLDANAYLWVLCQKLSEVLRTDKDSVYLTMLEHYGVFTHLVVKPNVVERVKAEWRTVRELGEVTINGTTGIQLQCYFGSHSYNTKEMSHLIDGVVNECKDLEIETLSPYELARMKGEWDAQTNKGAGDSKAR